MQTISRSKEHSQHSCQKDAVEDACPAYGHDQRSHCMVSRGRSAGKDTRRDQVENVGA